MPKRLLTFDLGNLTVKVGWIEIIAPDGDLSILDGQRPHNWQPDDGAAGMNERIYAFAEHDIAGSRDIDNLPVRPEVFADPKST
jgi:hypothetical protein